MELAVKQGETIRDWLRRVRTDRSPTVTKHLLASNNWPHIHVQVWTNLIGVAEWLDHHVGRENYVWAAEDFWFTTEQDAIMFKLTWYEKGSRETRT